MTAFESPEPITATIDVVVGDIAIRAGDRRDTTVEVRPSDASNAEDVKVAEATRVEFADQQLLVRTPRQRSWWSRSAGGSVDVTVELPAGSYVRGTAQSADFRCDGRLGDCRIRTGIGHIQVAEADTLNLRCGAGDVDVDRVTGHAEITTGSGDVRVRALDRVLRAKQIWVPNWYSGKYLIAYWDVFGRPAENPPYARGDAYWWFDQAKYERLKAEGALR
jgi:hypothetical protein